MVATASKETNKAKDEVDYDDLLTSAGELGRYQWRLFFAVCPFFAFGAFSYFSQIFITETSPNYWCRIPELANMTDISRRDLGIPKDVNSRFGYSQCEMYAVNWTEVLAAGQRPNSNWSKVPCQHGWEFNKTEIPYPTIGSDMEWVCDKNSYQATAQSMFFVGSILGGIILGWVADRFGRIPAIISSCLVGCIGGFASTFARNFIEFTAARFVMGISYDTCMTMPYIVILEYIAPKYRTFVANFSFAVFFSLFVTTLPWIALACGHWKTISLVTSLPLGLAVFTKFVLPESPRWLLTKGYVDEATEKILVISRTNKKKLPPRIIEKFKLSKSKTTKEQNQNWLECFRRPVTRRMFILMCLEFTCCGIVFDGIVRCIGQLDYDFFITFSAMSFTELPSVLIVAFAMDYTGRRWLCIVSMGISTIFCILIIFSTTGMRSMIYAVVARFGINIGCSVSLQWCAEILPTSVRGSGIAMVHICGYIATLLSPYIAYLQVFYYWLPLTIFSIICASGMFIAFALPETALKAMPNTFEEAEELCRNQYLWSIPFLEARKQKNKAGGQNNLSFE
ncbi:unnamed protein product [Arctia plantaginis]|uniref:Major facilitator superfamily (MFS) profile domain-containing protein n=1 Tax=Arctia plantaginis TaxID=874455 RepID=A0A8S0ZYX9_ARCPL|nr:unnamed protein product [Arctia plantaginis]